jgi:2-amino-4-hydroxy-6-hydroxymethyldihydropteridine diphosphokinase
MILVAIGANLPRPDGATPLQTCAEAARALAELKGLQFHSVSRWYETEPVPRSDQPNYINGVARLQRMDDAAIRPEVLLKSLQAIEDRFGRRRSEPNAPRTLDLDLIDLDGQVRATLDPILPHPRMHQRAFVLLPLLEVAPDWIHPTSGRTGRDLLATVDRSGVRLLLP